MPSVKHLGDVHAACPGIFDVSSQGDYNLRRVNRARIAFDGGQSAFILLQKQAIMPVRSRCREGHDDGIPDGNSEMRKRAALHP